eukprot:1138382-Pelagomonas_calceolata.AAC.16
MSKLRVSLLSQAHRHMRWTRCWNEWREVHRALGGRHTAGASGLSALTLTVGLITGPDLGEMEAQEPTPAS